MINKTNRGVGKLRARGALGLGSLGFMSVGVAQASIISDVMRKTEETSQDLTQLLFAVSFLVPIFLVFRFLLRNVNFDIEKNNRIEKEVEQVSLSPKKPTFSSDLDKLNYYIKKIRSMGTAGDNWLADLLVKTAYLADMLTDRKNISSASHRRLTVVYIPRIAQLCQTYYESQKDLPKDYRNKALCLELTDTIRQTNEAFARILKKSQENELQEFSVKTEVLEDYLVNE